MPRGKKHIAVTGEVGLVYQNVTDMPWEDIERQTGKRFSDDDRQEIYSIAGAAMAEYDVAVGAPPANDVEKLRKRIIKHAEGIVEIAKKYRTPEGLPLAKGGDLISSRNEAVFLGLAFSSDDPTFDLTGQLIAAAGACEDLVTDLSKISFEYERSLTPDSVLLAYFVGLSVKGASKSPARTREQGSPPDKPTAFEFHRWGLHLSPQTGDLPAFCSAIFEREVTQGQIQYAFGVARSLGLIE
jgi:hypothetical protein